MNYDDMDAMQQYAYDTAWASLQLAYEMLKQKRKAKAQEYLLDARYWAVKVPAGFTDNELTNNIEKLTKSIAFL